MIQAFHTVRVLYIGCSGPVVGSFVDGNILILLRHSTTGPLKICNNKKTHLVLCKLITEKTGY